ncbi:hypothetical protein LTR36_007838 [Oleoguttula mirabilis]|uniref:Myb-like domain-containing protein n=1 Tax=Oleoguttula mirabilis TaxID=1507867 RepID=A0AAV9J9G3_9PEZI|nr:hypothetical protein LTR36_007838 [Oleoguttula mirabilis]
MQITCKIWPAKPGRGFSAEATPTAVTDYDPTYAIACTTEIEETVHDLLRRTDHKLRKQYGTVRGYLDPFRDEVQNVKGAVIDYDDLVSDLFEDTTLSDRVVHILQGLKPGRLTDESENNVLPKVEPQERKKKAAPEAEKRQSRKRSASGGGEGGSSKRQKTEVLTPASLPAEQAPSQEAPTSAQRQPPPTQETPVSAQPPRASTQRMVEATQGLSSSQHPERSQFKKPPEQQRLPVGKGEKKNLWTVEEDTYFAQGLNDGLTTRKALEKYKIERTTGAARARKIILAEKGLLSSIDAAPAVNAGLQGIPNPTPISSGVLELASSPPGNAAMRRGASPQVVVPSTERIVGRSHQRSQPFLGVPSGSGGRQTTLDFWSSDPSSSHILDESPADRAANGPVRQPQSALSRRQVPATVTAPPSGLTGDANAETQVVPSSHPARANVPDQTVDFMRVETNGSEEEELPYGMAVALDGANDMADDTFMHIDEAENQHANGLIAADSTHDYPAAMDNGEQHSPSEDESDAEESTFNDRLGGEEAPSDDESTHSSASKSHAAQRLANTRTIEDSQLGSVASSTSSPPLVTAHSPAASNKAKDNGPAAIDVGQNDSSSTDGQDDLEKVAMLSAQEALDTQLEQRREDGRSFGLDVSAPVVRLPPQQTTRTRLRVPNFDAEAKSCWDKTDDEIMALVWKRVKDPNNAQEVRRQFEDEKHNFMTLDNCARHRGELNVDLHRIQKKREWDRAIEDGKVPPPRWKRRHGAVHGDLGEADEEVDYGSDYSYPGSNQYPHPEYYEEDEEEEDMDEDEEVDEWDPDDMVPAGRRFSRFALPEAVIEELGSEEASEQEVEEDAGDEAEEDVAEDQDEDESALPKAKHALRRSAPAVTKVGGSASPEVVIAAKAVMPTPASTSPAPAVPFKRIERAAKRVRAIADEEPPGVGGVLPPALDVHDKRTKRAAKRARAAVDEEVEEDETELPRASPATKSMVAAAKVKLERSASPEVVVAAPAMMSTLASTMPPPAVPAKRAARRASASAPEEVPVMVMEDGAGLPQAGDYMKSTVPAPKKKKTKKKKKVQQAASSEVAAMAPVLTSDSMSTASVDAVRLDKRTKRSVRRAKGAARRRSIRESSDAVTMSSEA